MKWFSSFFFIATFCNSTACTIVSGTDSHGHTWACNNEDWSAFSFYNYINVFPKTSPTKFGFITLTYGEPDGYIQGAVNEAGLFFDFNALPPDQYNNKLKLNRTLYPGGREALLRFIIENCKTVRDVISLCEKYYIPQTSQMHLADASGNLAIITPDSIIVETKKYQISTNFNLCDPDPVKYRCWRYPIAEKIISERGVNRDALTEAAISTFRGSAKSMTLYTNVHNLNTGEMWIYFGEDSANPWQTNLVELLRNGKRSILLSSLFPKHKAIQLHSLINSNVPETSIGDFLATFTPVEKESMLRMCYLSFLKMEHQIAKASRIFPRWQAFKTNNVNFDAAFDSVICATHYAYLGDFVAAESILHNLSDGIRGAEILRNSIGHHKSINSIRISLTGYENARSGYIATGDDLKVYFLHKESNGWVAYLPKDQRAKYVFYIDDQRILDPTSKETLIGESMSGKIEQFSVYNSQN